MNKTKIIITILIAFTTILSLSAQESQMIFVEGGTFQMGGFSSKEEPVHTVTVNDFYMSEYKISVEEWLRFFNTLPAPNYYNYIGIDPQDLLNSKNGGLSKIHLLGITWYNALIYCNRRSVAEGLTPCYSSNGSTDAVTYSNILDYNFTIDETYGEILPNVNCDWEADGYRLPTEAEWEYAARGGKWKCPYKYSGSDNYDDVAGNKLEKGTKKANKLGLYDMTCDATDWCWDYYSETYYKESNNSINPRGPDAGEYRCIRSPYKGEGGPVFVRGYDKPTRVGVNTCYSFRVVRNAK